MTVLELSAFRIFKVVNPVGEVTQESRRQSGGASHFALRWNAEGKEKQHLVSPPAWSSLEDRHVLSACVFFFFSNSAAPEASVATFIQCHT